MSILPHSLLDSQQFAVTDVMILFCSGESLTEMHMDVIYILGIYWERIVPTTSEALTFTVNCWPGGRKNNIGAEGKRFLRPWDAALHTLQKNSL